MKKEDIIAKVKNILCEVLLIDEVPDNAKQEDYSEWDSMAYLSIVSLLEDQFSLSISQENINCFNSIDSIVKEIDKIE